MLSKALPTGILAMAIPLMCCAAAHAQTDVAASLYGAFTAKTDGNGVQQSPSNAAGVMLEVRHIRNPIIGYEATYSYNRANEVYQPSTPLPASGTCPIGVPVCGSRPAIVSANAHELAGDWVASLHIANLRPFALAGVGVLFDAPVNASDTGDYAVKPVFVYGGGLDWGLLPHIGLRFQYRGNLYKAPNLTKLYTSTDAFTHTAEPMIGAYFRF